MNISLVCLTFINLKKKELKKNTILFFTEFIYTLALGCVQKGENSFKSSETT